jgi:two-component system LytT family sensor kinase
MFVIFIVCVVLIVLQVLIMYLDSDPKKFETMGTLHFWLAHIGSFVFMSVFYYYLANWYYSLITEKKRFARYVPVTGLAFLAYGSYYMVTNLLSPEWSKRKDLISSGQLVFSIIITAIIMTGIALLISYFTSLRDEQKQRKILEKQKMELEVENSQANFNFLKAQINPHFLHNTLNFFYAKALPLSAELSEGILCLSDIMRYALNEGGKDEKALLKDEIEHLENVIKINQFRFSNNLNVQFEVKGVTAGAMIVPFVLITLVENAFKHGDLKNREHPIVIRIIVEGKQLHFYCRNKKNPGFKEISTGIGLQNILKRLDIMYGDNYSYKVTEDTDFYSTQLIINSL